MTQSEWIPMNDQVLLKREKTEDKTAGGILLPEMAKGESVRAKVIAVGKGRMREDGRRTEPFVKTGDTVLLGKYTGSEIEAGGEKYLFVREDEILAVLAT